MSGFDTAITTKKLACRALLANHFSPLITHWSPSSSARVVNSVGSAPAWTSVIA